MSFWREKIFPYLCHVALSSDRFTKLRRTVVEGARGSVLELGVGTGLNLPHYPREVTEVHGIDPNPGMVERAREMAAKEGAGWPYGVEIHEARGEDLPFPDAFFDTVVSTWTLCSVDDVGEVLEEAHRVLRPGGRLLLIEHGLSHEAGVGRWQQRLTPIQKRVADGCHLDRDFSSHLTDSSLRIAAEERFYEPKTVKIAGYLYRMEARRP